MAAKIRLPKRRRIDPKAGSHQPGGYGFSTAKVASYHGDPVDRQLERERRVVNSDQFNRQIGRSIRGYGGIAQSS